MSIVKWITDNVDESQIESSEEVTLALLKMSPQDLVKRWEGRLIIKPLAAKRRVSVELRKHLYGANVVIKIFDRHIRDKHIMVNMSMSAAAGFSVEEMSEMNLAIAEGIAVYRLPEHWVKLNKYLEKSKGRRKRRLDGKFTKETI